MRGSETRHFLKLMFAGSGNHAAQVKGILVVRRSGRFGHRCGLLALGDRLPGRRRHFKRDGVFHRQILEFSLHPLALVETEQELPMGLLVLAALPDRTLEQIGQARRADRGDFLPALFQILQGFHQAAAARSIHAVQP